jgi:isopenicillin N synthase-like dioxygenase
MNLDNHLSTSLPIIDISDLSDLNSKYLVQKASKHGFLLLKNHLLDKEEIDKLFDISKEFFSQPDEIKNEFPITKNNDGYVAPFVENLQQDGIGEGDNKEAFNITNFNLSTFTPIQQLPEIFKNNMPFISFCLRKYYVTLHILCRMLAIGLEINDKYGNPNPDFFVRAHALDLSTKSTLRFLQYNKPDEEFLDKNLAGAHTDYGSMTFVLQRPHKGLQIFNGKDWIDVIVPEQKDGEELLIVNIGDVLNFWTDGYLKSTLHRVRTTVDRSAIVFFCHPADQSLLEPVNSEKVKNHKGHTYYLGKNGNALTALEHFMLRLKKGYSYNN